jgi:hypothetical protein
MFQHSAAGKREKKKKAEVGHVSSRPAAQKQKGSCMRSDTACRRSPTSIKAKKLLKKKKKKIISGSENSSSVAIRTDESERITTGWPFSLSYVMLSAFFEPFN